MSDLTQIESLQKENRRLKKSIEEIKNYLDDHLLHDALVDPQDLLDEIRELSDGK
jgi:hypothetical protein